MFTGVFHAGGEVCKPRSRRIVKYGGKAADLAIRGEQKKIAPKLNYTHVHAFVDRMP